MLDYDQHITFDATYHGSLARSVNHSCEPNCRMERWIVGGEPGIALYAGVDVDAGKELTFHYNFQKDDSAFRRCYCKEKRCTGLLGQSSKK